MRAKIIHRNGILLAAMVTLLSLAHATPAATNAEFVLFDRQFDLKNITTQDATVHVHIKDAKWNTSKNDADYTMPGEGDGYVRAVIKDLLASGYDGAFSIEPHVAVVFHDATVQASADEQFKSYAEYGRRLEKLVSEVQSELRAKKAA